MKIENDGYVVMISAFRVPNRHATTRFRYTITRKSKSPMLMIAGSAASEKEAAELAENHLHHFAEQDACRRTHARRSAGSA